MTQKNNAGIMAIDPSTTTHNSLIFNGNHTANNNDNPEKIEQLKKMLPAIPLCTTLKKESSTSLVGACPKCGGDDRFVYKTDSGRCWCRKCQPETELMDIIDFHCWLRSKTPAELIREYLPPDPKYQKQDSQNIDLKQEWSFVLAGTEAVSLKMCETLLIARGISPATIQSLHESGIIRGTSRHRRAESIAFPFQTITGEKIPLAIQYLTISQKNFFNIDKNKSFQKGSKAGGVCFFQCGKSITNQETKGIVVVESVINAISGADVLPEYSWLAIGGSDVKKLSVFQTYSTDGTIPQDLPIICAFDNDDAGKKATLEAQKLLKTVKNPLLTIQWGNDTPENFDINDFIRLDKDPTRTPQPEKIIELIQKAQPIKTNPQLINNIVHLPTKNTSNQPEDPTNNEDNQKPVVYLIAGKQPEIQAQCEEILLKDGCIFQRGQNLLRVSKDEQKPRKGITTGDAHHLQIITPLWLRNKLNELANFKSFNQKGDEIIKDCPKDIAESILENSGNWKFPYIAGTCETPTLRLDGSIIQKPGYDPETGIFMAINDNWNIPENPTKEEALQAYDKLDYLIKDFSFVDQESKTTAISAILTGLVRRILPTSPAFCFDAPQRGSGKTLLADTIGNIITGGAITTMSMGSDYNEFNKRIDSIIFRGDPVVNVDNIEIPVAGDTLNTILTSEIYNPRILGKSESPKCETNILILMTGNNCIFKGDMVRRVLISRIDPKCENPEERIFNTDLRQYARINRCELITAALTIMRAYHVAGAPRLTVPNYGSFEQWCEFARYPLIWLDKADPIKSREKIKNSDPVSGDLKELLEAWLDVYGLQSKTAKAICEDVRTKFKGQTLTTKHERLIDIIEQIASGKDGINNRILGKFLGKFRDIFKGELRLISNGSHNNSILYKIETTQKTTSTSQNITETKNIPATVAVENQKNNIFQNQECLVCKNENSCKICTNSENNDTCQEFDPIDY